MKKIIFLCALIFLTSCASSQKEIRQKLNTPIPKNKSKLIFQRGSQFVRSLASARIRTEGKTIATVANGDTDVAFLSPGKHILTVDNWGDFGKSTLAFNAKAGKSYYFKIEVRRSSFVPGGVVVFAPKKIDAQGNISGGPFRITLTNTQ